MNTIILRIENSNGKGAYRCGSGFCLARIAGLCEDLHSDAHPLPEHDLGMSAKWTELTYSERQLYKFGFSNVRQYLDWFFIPEGREAMARAGGVLHVYSVPRDKIIRGWHQVAVDSRYMTRIDSLSPDTPEDYLYRIFEKLRFMADKIGGDHGDCSAFE